MTLRTINETNWEEAIDLSVNDDQKRYIASNLYSIAEVQFLKNFQAKGIYKDNEMIGFTMFGIDPDDNNFWIYRLMLDKQFQGQGLSLPAIQLVINEIKQMNTTNIPFIMIGYNPENTAAKMAYQKAGFIETVVAPWGEQLAQFQL